MAEAKAQNTKDPERTAAGRCRCHDPEARVILHLQDGAIRGIEANLPVDVEVIDYDNEGYDPVDLNTITTPDGARASVLFDSLATGGQTEHFAHYTDAIGKAQDNAHE